MYVDYDPDEGTAFDAVMRVEVLYEWIKELILVGGMVYFLISSTTGSKNPNELWSFLALAIIVNCIFGYLLIMSSVHVMRDWINKWDEPDFTPAINDKTKTLTYWLFSITCVMIFCAVMFIAIIGLTIRPLRERIYEEIFWEIGANMNMVQMHKAKTSFFGVLKVDGFVQCLYFNTFAFLCVIFTETNGLKDLPYWILLGVIVVMAAANNIHGYYIMQTTVASLNTKVYFISRTVVQLTELYLAVTFMLDKTLTLT